MRQDQTRKPDDPQPETVRVTEADTDEAATYIAGLLNRMLGDLPATDNAYTQTAALENGKADNRSYSGSDCVRCGRPIWSDQARRRLISLDHKYVHDDFDDCD